MDFKDALDDEIKVSFEEMKGVDKGTEEYRNRIECVTRLIDRSIELDKTHYEYELDKARLENERESKVVEMERESKLRWTDRAINSLAIIIPAGCTIWGTIKTLKFEEVGTVSTIMGRGFINKLLPKK